MTPGAGSAEPAPDFTPGEQARFFLSEFAPRIKAHFNSRGSERPEVKPILIAAFRAADPAPEPARRNRNREPLHREAPGMGPPEKAPPPWAGRQRREFAEPDRPPGRAAAQRPRGMATHGRGTDADGSRQAWTPRDTGGHHSVLRPQIRPRLQGGMGPPEKAPPSRPGEKGPRKIKVRTPQDIPPCYNAIVDSRAGTVRMSSVTLLLLR